MGEGVADITNRFQISASFWLYKVEEVGDVSARGEGAQWSSGSQHHLRCLVVRPEGYYSNVFFQGVIEPGSRY
jgi:hypothetical protein